MAMTTKSPLATFRVTHSPTTATQATITQAANATPAAPYDKTGAPYLVVQGISVSIAAGGTAATPLKWNLIDGTTGGTNVLMGGALSAPVNQAANVCLDDLMIPAYSGNVTLEFSGAGVAASQEVVSMWGYHAGIGDV